MKILKIFLAILLLEANFSFANSERKIPPRPVERIVRQPDGEVEYLPNYIYDECGVMTAEEIRKYNILSDSLYRRTNVALAVAILMDIGDNDIREYALDIARNWGAGGPSNEGVFTLIAMKQREFSTEVGIGAEGYLTDARLHNLQNSHLVQAFKREEYGAGILAFSYRIAEVVAKEKGTIVGLDSSDYDSLSIGSIIFLVITMGILLTFILILILFKIVDMREASKTSDSVCQGTESGSGDAGGSSGGGNDKGCFRNSSNYGSSYGLNRSSNRNSSGGSRSSRSSSQSSSSTSRSSRGFSGGRYGGGGSKGRW